MNSFHIIRDYEENKLDGLFYSEKTSWLLVYAVKPANV